MLDLSIRGERWMQTNCCNREINYFKWIISINSTPVTFSALMGSCLNSKPSVLWFYDESELVLKVNKIKQKDGETKSTHTTECFLDSSGLRVSWGVKHVGWKLIVEKFNQSSVQQQQQVAVLSASQRWRVPFHVLHILCPCSPIKASRVNDTIKEADRGDGKQREGCGLANLSTVFVLRRPWGH